MWNKVECREKKNRRGWRRLPGALGALLDKVRQPTRLYAHRAETPVWAEDTRVVPCRSGGHSNGTGVPHSYETAPPYGPTAGLCLVAMSDEKKKKNVNSRIKKNENSFWGDAFSGEDGTSEGGSGACVLPLGSCLLMCAGPIRAVSNRLFDRNHVRYIIHKIHSIAVAVQGYLAHKKPPPCRTLQWDHA